MRAVTVYRLDYTMKTKYPLGVVLEQRQTERVNNYSDLLRLARSPVALEPADAINIIIDVGQARRACLPEQTRDCSMA